MNIARMDSIFAMRACTSAKAFWRVDPLRIFFDVIKNTNSSKERDPLPSLSTDRIISLASFRSIYVVACAKMSGESTDNDINNQSYLSVAFFKELEQLSCVNLAAVILVEIVEDHAQVVHITVMSMQENLAKNRPDLIIFQVKTEQIRTDCKQSKLTVSTMRVRTPSRPSRAP